MASYHLTAKIGKKGKAAAHAAYISREGKYSSRDRYEDLEATASGNMPAWAAHNSAHFWTAADGHERANGSVYREIEVALPRELSPAQRLELVEEFIKQEIGDKHAYQYAIHTPKAALEKQDQPHAHIMYSERIRDGIERDPEHYFKRYNAKNPEKGGAKKFSGGKSPEQLKTELLGLRERWADLQNAHLEKHGHESRVDHRSLKDQGIDRAPEKHLGVIGVSRLNANDISALLERRAAEGELERAQKEVSIIDLSGDIKKAKAERQDLILKSWEPVLASVEQGGIKKGFQGERLKELMEVAKANLIDKIESGEYSRIYTPPAEQTKPPEEKKIITPPQPKPQRQEVTPEQAEHVKKGFIDEAREAWRMETTQLHTRRAGEQNITYLELLKDEPKEPRIFGKKEWAQQHRLWAEKTNEAKAKAEAHQKNASDTLERKFDHDPATMRAWERTAQERLEIELPELAQVLKAHQQAEQHKAAMAAAKAARERNERMAIEKAISEFKSLALKREGKHWGYGDNGNKWDAVPDELKDRIEAFNKHPRADRDAILETMRKGLTRSPSETERLTKQLEQGQDRGMER